MKATQETQPTTTEKTYTLTEAAKLLGLKDPLYARQAARSIWGNTRTAPWRLTEVEVLAIGAERTLLDKAAAKLQKAVAADKADIAKERGDAKPRKAAAPKKQGKRYGVFAGGDRVFEGTYSACQKAARDVQGDFPDLAVEIDAIPAA